MKNLFYRIVANLHIISAGGLCYWYVLMVSQHGWHPGHPIF